MLSICRLFVSLLALCLLVCACSDKSALKNAEVTKLSVSSDGKYVISGYDNHYLVLWDIPNRSYHVISQHANDNSPYFIKHTHQFIWQNTHNQVYVQNINGKTIQQFLVNYSVLSQVMTSNLQTYISEDKHWKLYKGYNKNTITMKKYGIGEDKPLNLTLSHNDKYLLTSGSGSPAYDKMSIKDSLEKEGINELSLFGGVTLWNVKTGKPIKKYSGSSSSTYATISPNTQYVLSGDLNGSGGLYHLETGKSIYQNLSLEGRLIQTGKEKFSWNKKGFPPIPKNFRDYNDQLRGQIFSMKYITNNTYLRFTNYISYAILYQGTSAVPKKYLSLGKVPFPSVGYYSRDESIDTSPSTHILVTGQEVDDGINVYQYDPKTKTLYRVWTPIINKRSNMPPISKDVPTLPGVKFSDLTKVKQVG